MADNASNRAEDEMYENKTVIIHGGVTVIDDAHADALIADGTHYECKHEHTVCVNCRVLHPRPYPEFKSTWEK
jgi:hypothetical protein